MRVRFSDLFRENPDGTLSPLATIAIGGVVISPGVNFSRGVSFSGVDVFAFYGRDIEADLINGVYVVRGFYG